MPDSKALPDAEIAAMVERLKRVAKPRPGLELNDTLQYHADYWFKRFSDMRDVGLDAADMLTRQAAELRAARTALPDDLRAKGWAVAIHNDYWLNGERKTFWLFTHRDGRWIKGEGATDEGALNAARACLPDGETG